MLPSEFGISKNNRMLGNLQKSLLTFRFLCPKIRKVSKKTPGDLKTPGEYYQKAFKSFLINQKRRSVQPQKSDNLYMRFSVLRFFVFWGEVNIVN